MPKNRRAPTIVGLSLMLSVASTAAVARPTPAPIRGITVRATTTPLKWLGLFPSSAVRFEMEIYVDRRVPAFSAIQYECHFVDGEGVELGVASRGVAARAAFTTMENDQLVARTHEELVDREPTPVRCRATKLER